MAQITCDTCGENYVQEPEQCRLCDGSEFTFYEKPNCQVYRDQQQTVYNAEFIAAFNTITKQVHQIAVEHGWWDSDRSDGETIALCHSELSEALEAARNGYPADDKLPDHGNYEVEMADTIIRIMDDAGRRGINLGKVIIDKINYNRNRPYKHGGKRF